MSNNWSNVCAKSDGLNDRFVTSIHSMHVSCFVLSFIHGMQRRGHARLRNCWANFSSRINFFKLTKIDAKVRVP